MIERNPYAPPKANLADIRAANCTRDGKSVVVRTGSDLPPRCIVCNAPAKLPVKSKKVYWHSPWIYLLVPINILIYLIVGLIARKSFEVSAGLCEVHSARRRWRVLSLVAVGVGSLIVTVAMLIHEQGDAAIVAAISALAAFVFSAIAARKIYPRKITKEYARLGGCKEPFLASLE
jgi:hypothetical protein